VHENLVRSETDTTDSEKDNGSKFSSKKQSHNYVDVMASRQDEVDQRLLTVALAISDKTSLGN
jgi:hypothetical protein